MSQHDGAEWRRLSGTYGTNRTIPIWDDTLKQWVPGGLSSADIPDFAEAAQDAVGASLTDTATVDLTYNDALNQMSADVKKTLDSSWITNFTEAAQDAVGAALTDTATIDMTYDDAGNIIKADVKAGSIGPTQIADRARYIWVPAGNFLLALASPTFGLIGAWPNGTAVWALHKATLDGVSASSVLLPSDWTTSNITIRVVYSAIGPGNIVLQVVCLALLPNFTTALNAAPTYVGNVTTPATSGAVGYATTSPVLNVPGASAFFRFAVARVSTDAADTCATDVWFHGLWLEYTADS